jgi:hypothetical protein
LRQTAVTQALFCYNDSLLQERNQKKTRTAATTPRASDADSQENRGFLSPPRQGLMANPKTEPPNGSAATPCAALRVGIEAK